MRFRIALLLLVAIALPLPALAQSVPNVGERVRVTSSGGVPVTGRLTLISSDEVQVERADGRSSYVVRRQQLQSLERSLGDQRKFARNFLMTVGISAVALGAVNAAAYDGCNANEAWGCFLQPDSRTQAFFWGAAVGGFVGVPVGVVTGLLLKHESWQDASLPGMPDAQLTLVPTAGRGLGITGTIPLGF